MNPIEQIWKELRARGFHNEVFQTLDKVVDSLCDTILSLTCETIRRITGSSRNCHILIEEEYEITLSVSESVPAAFFGHILGLPHFVSAIAPYIRCDRIILLQSRYSISQQYYRNYL